MELVSHWESKLSNPNFLEEYNQFVMHQLEMEEIMWNARKRHRPEFHPQLVQAMANSRALLHPHLLPDIFPSALYAVKDNPNPKYDNSKIKHPYTLSEEQ